MSKKKTIWAFDCETPPFKHGREDLIPFAFGAISDEGERVAFWGDDAAAQFIAWAETIPAALFIAHNGGKFDALFLRDGISGEMLVMDGRIVKCKFLHHEMRDSYSILPMPLKKLGAKGSTDLTWHEKDQREAHKGKIIAYMMQDCVVLLDAVIAFYEQAGKRRLTVASTAFAELKKTEGGQKIKKQSETHDKEFRRFYFGGRVEYFEQGIITGDFHMYDVNSMYPAVMKHYRHPIGSGYRICKYSKASMPKDGAFFADIDCYSLGAFPLRDPKKKTTKYAHGRISVSITGHELIAALECGAVNDVSGTLFIPHDTVDFAEYVETHYSKRNEAKANKNQAGDIFHKLMLNSAYGKLASSPDDKEEIYFAEHGERKPHGGWRTKALDMDGQRIIYARPVQRPEDFYNDVATGASITGAARSVLLRAFAKSKRPIYCDTDSLICEEFRGDIHEGRLGAWKHELSFDTAAIAGKKLYVLIKDKRPLKWASKGVKACPTEIYMAADGETVSISRDAPTMGLRGFNYVTREIKRT